MNTNWRARIDRFYKPGSPTRTALPLAAAFLFASFLLLIPGWFCIGLLDMDGHSAAEEPIRAFLYQSIRVFFLAVFGLPHALGDCFSGILRVIVTLATLPVIPLAFGISATALLEWRRLALARRVVTPR
jgi:hypothetical protein